MSDKNNGTSGGIGVCGLLGVAFVILKLCHVIDWRWRWVLGPFWIPMAILLAVLLVIGVIYLICSYRSMK